MDHRERVLTALDHQEPDRCPMQISFTPEFAARLEVDLRLKGQGLHNPHGGGNTYELERALDEDMLLTSVGWVNGYYQDGYQNVDSYQDEWGVTWKTVEYDTPYGKGKYTEPHGHPLAEDAALAVYRSPDPERPELYTEAQRVLAQYKDEYWIVGVTPTTIFECAWALRGYERLMMDLAMQPDIANRILDIPFNYHKAVTQRLVRMGVDMIWLGDDMGGQNGMLMSPRMWRQYFKPRMAGLIAALRAINPHIKVAYHTDGVVYPIIPDLIEIGINILNPIQPMAMDPVRLKLEYGRELSFWGSLDIQKTLPFGSPAEVRAEVITRLQTIGKGGGLLIGPTHNLQLDTPLENFWAMLETIRSTAYKDLS
ncbi:MAG TPA: uroporphyrinogen decarboxylase family protein [Anaerolineales bacterium]|nr:uroporphyrinogen decarboxylase family protein [Anaerolineales bacterium]